MARYRKPGSFVFVKDKELLKKSFGTFLPCQVFMVSEHALSTNKKPYVWIESNSMGLPPAACVTATKEQIKQYKREKKARTFLFVGNSYELPKKTEPKIRKVFSKLSDTKKEKLSLQNAKRKYSEKIEKLDTFSYLVFDALTEGELRADKETSEEFEVMEPKHIKESALSLVSKGLANVNEGVFSLSRIGRKQILN